MTTRGGRGAAGRDQADIRIVLQFDSNGEAAVASVDEVFDRIRKAVKDDLKELGDAFQDTFVDKLGDALQGAQKETTAFGSVFRDVFAANVFSSAARSLTSGFFNVVNTGFSTLVSGAEVVSDTFNNVASAIIETTGAFQEYSIALEGSLKVQPLVERSLRFAERFSSASQLQFEQIAGALRSLAAIPSIRPLLLDIENLEGNLTGLFNTVQGLAALRPDVGPEGAVFALREALAGQFRSFQFRFDIDPRVVAASIGKTVDELKSSTADTLRAFGTFIEQNVGAEVSQKLSRTFAVQIGNVGDFFQQLRTAVGEAGFVDLVTDQIIRLNEALEEFQFGGGNRRSPEFLDFVDNVNAGLESVIRGLVSLENAAIGAFNRVLGLNPNAGLGETVKAAADVLGKSARVLGEAFEAGSELFGQKGQEAFLAFADGVESFAGVDFSNLKSFDDLAGALDSFVEKFGGLGENFTKSADAFKPVIEAFKTLVNALLFIPRSIFKGLQAIGTFIGKVAGELTAAVQQVREGSITGFGRRALSGLFGTGGLRPEAQAANDAIQKQVGGFKKFVKELLFGADVVEEGFRNAIDELTRGSAKLKDRFRDIDGFAEADLDGIGFDEFELGPTEAELAAEKARKLAEAISRANKAVLEFNENSAKIIGAVRSSFTDLLFSEAGEGVRSSVNSAFKSQAADLLEKRAAFERTLVDRFKQANEVITNVNRNIGRIRSGDIGSFSEALVQNLADLFGVEGRTTDDLRSGLQEIQDIATQGFLNTQPFEEVFQKQEAIGRNLLKQQDVLVEINKKTQFRTFEEEKALRAQLGALKIEGVRLEQAELLSKAIAAGSKDTAELEASGRRTVALAEQRVRLALEEFSAGRDNLTNVEMIVKRREEQLELERNIQRATFESNRNLLRSRDLTAQQRQQISQNLLRDQNRAGLGEGFALTESFANSFRAAKGVAEANFDEIVNLGQTAATRLQDAFDNSFFKLFKGEVKGIGDIFRNLLSDLSNAILRTFARQATNRIIGGLLGGILPGFADGGIVNTEGPTPIMVNERPGLREAVIPLRNGAVPVSLDMSQMPMPEGGGGTTVIVVKDEKEATRQQQLAGGKALVVRTTADNLNRNGSLRKQIRAQAR